MTQLSMENYQERKWRSTGKCRGLSGNTPKPFDEENMPPNLDYKALEQIADGVEKMVLSWNKQSERQRYLPPCMQQSLETNKALPGNGANIRILPFRLNLYAPELADHQNPPQDNGVGAKCLLSEKCLGEDGVCNYKTLTQEKPVDLNTDVSVAEKLTCLGLELSINQLEKESAHLQECLIKQPTYWHMEARDVESISPCENRREIIEKRLGPKAEGTHQSQCKHETGPSAQVSHQTEHNRIRQHAVSKPYSRGDDKLVTRSDQDNIHSVLHPSEENMGTETPIVYPKQKVSAENFNVHFGCSIIDDELLERKLASLTTMPPTPLLNPPDVSDVERDKQVQDLQIALLECAMEYELKTIELKMKLKSLQSTPKHSTADSKLSSEKTSETLCSHGLKESQIVESMKRQIFKLQREKGALSKELGLLRTRERKFETQKRNLDDALLRVNRLTKELVKKEYELTEVQLLEKQTRVQLQDTEQAMVKLEASHMPTPQTRMDPANVVAALPSLREWVKGLKKEHAYEPMLVKMVDGYYNPGEDPEKVVGTKLKSNNEQTADGAHKVVEKVIHVLMKEVHALQRELSKLGHCRTFRPKSTPISGEFLKNTHVKKDQSKHQAN